MPSYGRIARAGLYWAYSRHAFSWLVGVPTTIALARLLTPSDFGVAAAALFFIKLATKLSRSGLNTSLVRAKEIQDLHVSSVFVFYLALNTVLAAALTLSAPLIAIFFDNQDIARALPVATIAFVINGVHAVPLALLRRAMRYREIAMLQSAGLVVESVLAVVLAVLGFGFWSIILASLANALVHTSISIYVAAWTPRLRFSPPAFRELASFGVGLYVVRTVEYAALNIDNLLVARLLGITALGYYDKAFTIAHRVTDRINAAGPSVVFRIFALIQEDPERFRRAYRKVVLSVGLVGYPTLVTLVAVAPQLILGLLGDQWGPAVLPFQILCIAGMLKILNEYASAAIQAAGRPWSEVWRQVTYAAVITAGIVLLRPWGVTGAALAVLGGTVIFFLLMNGLVRTVLPLRWTDLLGPQLPGLACGISLGILCLGVEAALTRVFGPVNDLVLLGTQLPLAGLFYLAFVWFSRFAEVRALVRETLADVAPALAARLRPATGDADA